VFYYFTPDEDLASYVTSAWLCLWLELCQYKCRWLADLGIWGWQWVPRWVWRVLLSASEICNAGLAPERCSPSF